MRQMVRNGEFMTLFSEPWRPWLDHPLAQVFQRGTTSICRQVLGNFHVNSGISDLDRLFPKP